ncbi:MAG: hypothetical protein V8S24_10320 [Gordonibacter pamelaeae]
MADDQDRTVPLPENPEPQQPGGAAAPARCPRRAAPEPMPTPPPPPAPGQAQPAQPYQAAAP